jgi:hypothetical protein
LIEGKAWGSERGVYSIDFVMSREEKCAGTSVRTELFFFYFGNDYNKSKPDSGGN